MYASCFRLLAAGLLCAPLISSAVQEDTQTPTLDRLLVTPDAYYRLRMPADWRVKPVAGGVELRGREAAAARTTLRVYAVGLRAVGGKFRDLEHVLDDLVFQIRDEHGGSADAKQTVRWRHGEDEITGRSVTGSMPQRGGAHRVRYVVIPGPVDGVVVAITMQAPPDDFRATEPTTTAILHSVVAQTPLPEDALQTAWSIPGTHSALRLPAGWTPDAEDRALVRGPDGLTLHALRHRHDDADDTPADWIRNLVASRDDTVALACIETVRLSDGDAPITGALAQVTIDADRAWLLVLPSDAAHHLAITIRAPAASFDTHAAHGVAVLQSWHRPGNDAKQDRGIGR